MAGSPAHLHRNMTSANLTAVIGPPGCGKTRTIAAEIEEEMAVGLPADRLLAITFTRAAAAQLRERCQLPKGRGMTLHGLAWRHADPDTLEQIDRHRNSLTPDDDWPPSPPTPPTPTPTTPTPPTPTPTTPTPPTPTPTTPTPPPLSA